jgi:hypothetical protein
VPLLPDGSWYGYRLAAEIECSQGCEAPEILWWQGWRLADLTAHEPVEPDERARRYAAGALRRILGELPEVPTERQLTGSAYQTGRWLETGRLPAEPVAGTLLAAAARAGLDPVTIAPKLAAALTAGRARPGRLPR